MSATERFVMAYAIAPIYVALSPIAVTLSMSVDVINGVQLLAGAPATMPS